MLNPETIERRYAGKLSNKALHLMQGMLKMDPKEWMSSIECLTHSYFDDLRLNDPDFLKIINDESDELNENSTPMIVWPIQSSQGPTTKRPLLSRSKKSNPAILDPRSWD